MTSLCTEGGSLAPGSVHTCSTPVSVTEGKGARRRREATPNLLCLSSAWPKPHFLPLRLHLTPYPRLSKSTPVRMTPALMPSPNSRSEEPVPNGHLYLGPQRRLDLAVPTCLISHLRSHTCSCLSLRRLGQGHHHFSRESILTLLCPPRPPIHQRAWLILLPNRTSKINE